MTQSTKKKHILYVEDDEIAANIGQHILGLFDDVDVTYSATGYGALEAYNPGDYDLLIVDLGLPDISGVELVQMIKKQYKSCPPTVAITAHVTPDDGPIRQIDKVYVKPLTFDMAKEIFSLLDTGTLSPK